jgi:hypothetical protein
LSIREKAVGPMTMQFSGIILGPECAASLFRMPNFESKFSTYQQGSTVKLTIIIIIIIIIRNNFVVLELY